MRERPRVQQAAVEEAVAFLKKVPPFQFLEDPPLRELARAIELEYYPTGTVILEQDGPPSEHLLVVKKGGPRSPSGRCRRQARPANTTSPARLYFLTVKFDLDFTVPTNTPLEV